MLRRIKEFVLTDCGMSTEYEGFHLITGGVDISKVSYLQAQSKAHSAEYGMLMATNCVMYENYNLFVISSSRCMVGINPFFRLYHGFQTACVDERGVMSNESTLKSQIYGRQSFKIKNCLISLKMNINLEFHIIQKMISLYIRRKY